MSTAWGAAQVLDPGDDVQTERHLQLAPEGHVVGEARTFVLQHAPPLAEGTRETLRLLTSELVTNAVIHARTPIDLAVVVAERHVLVMVHDLDIGHVQARGSTGREGGWGLGLVRSLATRWDLTRHPGGGKTAWFTLLRDA